MDQDQKQTAIIQQVCSVPKGNVASYGDIAKGAGLPGYARYVGRVLKMLPKNTNIPWHRIINSQGMISFPKGSDAYKKQVERLNQEGIYLLKDKIPKSYFIR